MLLIFHSFNIFQLYRFHFKVRIDKAISAKNYFLKSSLDDMCSDMYLLEKRTLNISYCISNMPDLFRHYLQSHVKNAISAIDFEYLWKKYIFGSSGLVKTD